MRRTETVATIPTLSSLVRIDVAAQSHTGHRRANNEDHFLVTRLSRTLQTLITSLPSGDVPLLTEEVNYVLIVADGIFGFLKFFEPFHTWFHTQIATSGLPPFCIPVGIAGELSIGLSLLLASSFRQRINKLFTPIVALASAGLIVNMAVAIYVHLQAGVPADVLPLGIKPPFIPLVFVLLAGLNLFQLFRPMRMFPQGSATR